MPVAIPAGGSASASTEVEGPGPGGDSIEVVEDRLLVRWAEGSDDATRARALAALAELVAEGADAETGTGPGTEAGTEAGTDPGIGAGIEVAALTPVIDAVTLPGGDLLAAVRTLRADPAVALVEPDRVLEAGAAADTLEPPVLLSPPTDPLFPQQWGLQATGATIGLDGVVVTPEPGVDVRALEAWEVTRGSPEVMVAVLDAAVDVTHPDLAGVVRQQIDVAPGPITNRFHGTAVASVIAARADDGIGMAGMAPEVRILSVAAFSGGSDDDPGGSTLGAVIAGFEAATLAGADVITASWVSAQDSPLLRSVIADAGVPVVAASGNEGRELNAGSLAFPAVYELDNLVTVTAIGPTGLIPGFASVGAATVDLAAPGQMILVAAPGGRYGFANGTSFAVPHVAGALALALSAAPELSTRELLDALAWTTRAEDAVTGWTRTGGVLDAAALLAGIQRPVCGPYAGGPSAFEDLPAEDPHAAAVACLVAEGVVTGQADGTFVPEQPLTRQQAASVLVRSLERAGPLPPAPDAGFVDVARDGAHAVAIDQLAAVGITVGTGDGAFSPGEVISRGQLTSWLVATHELLAGPLEPPSRQWFPDTTTSVHGPNIARARDIGLVDGVGRLRFAPMESLSRATAASMLARHLDALAREGVVW